MAAKEATVFIVDVGSTMKGRSSGRDISNFDYCMKYVWDKLTTTIATGRKTLLSGVVALRSERTENELQDESSYQHIEVLVGLKQLLMSDVRDLREQLKAGKNAEGDLISSIVVAIQMISETCKQLKYARRIIIITDARAPMDSSELDDITTKMKEDNIELTILGVDFDDADAGVKEEDKDPLKADNEATLQKLCEDVDGNFASVNQAVQELEIPRVKQVKPMPSYKGFLTLGDPTSFDDAITINVERYPKTMIARPPTASSFVVRADAGDADDADGLSSVKNARTYQIKDEEAPGGKREINFDDLAKGYEYGRTAVHISESDQNVTTFESPAGFDILGFVDAAKYSRFFDMSRTNVIIADQRNEKAVIALSSFIHALYELDTYAVARLVTKPNKDPLLILLTPSIEPDLECLYDVELPFTEDIRMYRFPPLDKIITVSGKTVSAHRNLPSEDLQTAMDKYVDAMDLTDVGGAEYMPMDETFSPVLHHLGRAIQQRAIYPEAPPIEPAEILIRYSKPPTEVAGKAKPALDQIIAAADIKKVPPKARGKRFGRKEEKPLSDLDVAALLAADPKRQQKRISSKNAVPEFKQILATSNSVDEIHNAAKQMGQIVRDWIRYSVGDSSYERAVEAIKVMRDELNELEEPKVYNDFLVALKDELKTEALGGNRKDMWWLMRVNKVGPITNRDCTASTVDDDEARKLMAA